MQGYRCNEAVLLLLSGLTRVLLLAPEQSLSEIGEGIPGRETW